MKRTTDEILDLLETANTKCEKIKLINELIDRELGKNKIDWSLIDECNEFLGLLDSTDFTHEELLVKLSEIIKAAPKKKRKPIKKILLRIIAATAAVVIVSITVLTVIEKNNGDDCTWESASENVIILLKFSHENEVAYDIEIVTFETFLICSLPNKDNKNAVCNLDFQTAFLCKFISIN